MAAANPIVVVTVRSKQAGTRVVSRWNYCRESTSELVYADNVDVEERLPALDAGKMVELGFQSEEWIFRQQRRRGGGGVVAGVAFSYPGIDGFIDGNGLRCREGGVVV